MIMLYDGLVVIALLMLTTILAMALGMENRTAGKDPIYTAGLMLVWFSYLAWCWRNGGMTLGMRAWKARIISDENTIPRWSQCIIRFLVSLLSAATAGLGFIWSVFRKDRRTWHDLVSRTHLQRTEPVRRSGGE